MLDVNRATTCVVVCVFLYVDCVGLSFLIFFFVYAAIEIFSMNKVD